MLSSPRKFKKFQENGLGYEAASWLADTHTYIADKKIQLKQRAKRLQNALGDWDYKLISFNKDFVEWVVSTGNDELAKKVSIAADDSMLEPITKDYRVDYWLEKWYPEMSWAEKTRVMLDTEAEIVE